MKFSVIVPVYNVSLYIEKCLTSIFNSSYSDYEVIIVNDGSTDDSEKKVKDIIKDKKNVKYIKQSNKGLSAARNKGVKLASGEYIIFVDSDDFIDKELLKKLSKCDSDVIRYQACIVNDNEREEKHEDALKKSSGVDAFRKIVKSYFVENAWLYAYKREFFINNKFKFKEGVFHEDYGLTPVVLYNASSVEILDFIGYYYVQRDNSIMSSVGYEKIVKKCFDMLDLCIQNKNYFIKKSDSKYFLSFISNSAIVKARELHGEEYKKYVNKLKEEKIFDYVLTDSISRKFKKIIMKLNLKMYLKIVK